MPYTVGATGAYLKSPLLVTVATAAVDRTVGTMSSLFRIDGRPALVGHRGLGRGLVLDTGSLFPENTLASCLRAVEVGAHWVEIDVVRTLDDSLVLSHDLTVTDAAGRRRALSSLTTQAARDLGLPTLDDLFGVLPATVGVVVEVKSGRCDPDPARTVSLAADAVLTERLRRPLRPVLLYGFHFRTPQWVRGHCEGRQFPLGVIARPGVHLERLTRRALDVGASAIAPHVSSLLGPLSRGGAAALVDRVAAVQSQGLEIMVWTPSARQAVRLLAAGVDAACVDDISSTRRLLASD